MRISDWSSDVCSSDLHMLVITGDDDKSFVIKHWRQGWEYEPAKILAYSDRNSWAWEDVPERMRTGRWSPTVYQVDERPRYAGWGQFEKIGRASFRDRV